MSDCCEKSSGPDCATNLCPASGKPGQAVAPSTVLHHLAKPWLEAAPSASYFFCADPACDVVYFGRDGSVFRRADLRTDVGLKSARPESTLCYCFGVSYAAAAADPAIRDFVIEQTRNKACACETHNPSGTCCLKTFPRTT